MKIKYLSGSAIVLSIFLLAACNSNKTSNTTSDTTVADSAERQKEAKTLKPAGPEPEWGKGIKPEMQTVIEKLESFGDKPIETLTAVEARKNHTVKDAVMDLIAEHGILMPAPKCDTVGKAVPVPGGKVHVRIYTPKGNAEVLPVVIYYHGGGFVIANIDVYHASAQALCEETGAIVVSVGYRLAPENKFPTAHNDSFAAYEWVTKNAASFNGDPARIAVVGESAGGNLAANMSIM
ncbi:MAG: steryl acetyl hydrolase, partial [Chitinophagaceae bacterium]